MTRPIRVVIADDIGLLRQSLSAILSAQPDVEVVGEAANGAEAVEIVLQQQPDVVLMDIQMPGDFDGIDATRTICGHPDLAHTRVAILTMFDGDQHVFNALQAGASGYLLKDTSPDGVVDAVRTLHAGRALLSPQVLHTIAVHAVAPQRPMNTVIGLTPRLTEVLRLVAAGLSNEEIERKLVITHSTMKSHMAALLSRLGARDRAQLVIAAYELGLTRPGTR